MKFSGLLGLYFLICSSQSQGKYIFIKLFQQQEYLTTFSHLRTVLKPNKNIFYSPIRNMTKHYYKTINLELPLSLVKRQYKQRQIKA